MRGLSAKGAVAMGMDTLRMLMRVGLQQRHKTLADLATVAVHPDDLVAIADTEAPAPFLTIEEITSMLYFSGIDISRIRLSLDSPAFVAPPTFGAKLKELRVKASLTQKAAAEKVGIPLPSYSQYENDKRNPTYATVLKIARNFKVDANYFADCDFGDEDSDDDQK
jgi:DNA-binding XRE family transcriptional regulator